jgi:DNA-binding response OmpR family regulator
MMGKILIVDDDPDVRMVLALTLEEAGHEIEEASDGIQVLSMARETSPDAILLDINMPGMNGFQALEQLRSHRDTEEIPVIMISARARPRDREDALSMGAVDYVTKPWSEGEVELRVDWVLNQRSKSGGVSGGHFTTDEEVAVA